MEGRLDCDFNKPINRNAFVSSYPFYKVSELSFAIVHPPEYERVYSDCGYQLLRAQNVRPTGIELNVNPVFFSKEYISKKRVIKAEKGDLLVVRSGVNVGDCAVIDDDYHDVIIGADNVLCKCQKNIVYSKYLQVFFFTEKGRNLLTRYVTGATNKHITPYNFGKIKIPLLPLDNQKQVIKIFVDALASKKQKETRAQALLDSIDDYLLGELGIQLPPALANGLGERVFLRRFSDLSGSRFDPLFYTFSFKKMLAGCQNVVKLASVVDCMITGFAAGHHMQPFDDSGIIQIRPTNINEQRELIFDRNIYVKQEFINQKKTDLLNYNEVLFNNTNSQELVGKSVVFDLDGQYFCSNHITRLQTNPEKLDSHFLTAIFNFYQRRKVFYNLCTNWNNQSGININVLAKIDIPLPTLDKQKTIAAEIQKRRTEAKKLKEEAAAELVEAKKSIEKMILGEA